MGFARLQTPLLCSLDMVASAEGVTIKSSAVPEPQLQVSARFLVGTVHQPAQSAGLAQRWDRFQSEFFICNN